jgi:hypothetical protein
MEKMQMTRRWSWIGLAGLCLALAGGAGCQTWVAGMTLPSGHYLEHSPQYIVEGPDFPLPRELARMEEAQPIGGGPGPVGLPPRVPPGGLP